MNSLLKKELGKFTSYGIFQVILVLILTAIEISTPLLEGMLINNLVAETLSKTYIYLCLGGVAIFVARLMVSYFSSRIEYVSLVDVNYKLYQFLVNKIFQKDYSSLENYEGQYLNSRINSDLEIVVHFLFVRLPKFIKDVLTLVVISLILFYLERQVFLYFYLIVLVYIGIYLYFRQKMYSSFNIIRERDNHFAAGKSSIFQRLSEIFIQRTEEFEGARLNKKWTPFMESVKANFGLRYTISTIQIVTTFLAQALFFWVGGVSVVQKKMTIGSFTAVIQYFSTFISSVDNFFYLAVDLEEYRGAVARLNELLDLPQDIEGDLCPQEINNLSVTDLNLSRPAGDIEDHLYTSSLTANFKRGQIYFIKGKNGSGKTSLMKTLVGLLKNNYEGSIKINNQDINSLDLRSLRKKSISFMVQNNVCQTISVADVLETYLPEDDLKKILRTSPFDKFINFLPSLMDLKQDFDSYRHKKFENLSGGERQLINLLATLTKPQAQLIILDEPFSNISNKLYPDLLKIIKECAKDKIILIISHDKLTDNAANILYVG
ncbi:ABC transporter ATP-binding protein [Streptococcaceae bacterium ESL0729]|nr:ABC transporter ATP-binding protein [Streptococcaceae bacterium ESL0729]